MTQSTHTPGPWVQTSQVAGDEDISLYAYTKVHRNPHWIARVYGQGRLAKKDPETAANANLIAAAPDMLAELEQALSCLRQYRDYGEAMRSIGRGFQAIDTVGRTIDSVILGIESAIAKAKGE